MENINDKTILTQSIFRIGSVFSVSGREIKIKVDKKKNLTHLFYNGELIKNVSVGSYIKILKGFIPIIAKVESEYIFYDNEKNFSNYVAKESNVNRTLIVSLLGFFETDRYIRGVKEIPLIDNECFLLSTDEFSKIHKFTSSTDDIALKIGTLATDSFVSISLGTKKLFSNHIGIFGNTGSGKSYTLAKLYRELFKKNSSNEKFEKNAHFVFFDFNGEYSGENTIINEKKVYNLSTRNNEGDKIPMANNDFLNLDLLCMFANATEKTQRPFISRCIQFEEYIRDIEHFKNLLKKYLVEILCMSDKQKAELMLDYVEQIIPPKMDDAGIEINLRTDFSYHDTNTYFYIKTKGDAYQGKFSDTTLAGNSHNEYVKETAIFQQIEHLTFPSNFIEKFIKTMYLKLIRDILDNRAMNEHISPAIHKLTSGVSDIKKTFDFVGENTFWDKNIVIVNLDNVNTESKKMIPMVLAHKLYKEHKEKNNNNSSYLNIIVDEAHNILSYQSNRENETWKDYRLEVFEEIIKEGRKFGVFLTIASQRPSDISSTIISQLHNYFIHRLINDRDIEMVKNTISYLDKVSAENLPNHSIGVCVIAGQLVEMPIVVQIDEIEEKYKPLNETLDIIKLWEKL